MPATTTGCVSCCSGDGVDGGPLWWCDPRPNFNANPFGTSATGTGEEPPSKRQKGGAAAAAAAEPEEPELDDAVQARLAMLKGDVGATVD